MSCLLVGTAGQSSTATVSPSCTVWPSATLISRTLPARGASTGISIFMDSSTMTGSPAATASPGLVVSWKTTPVMWALTSSDIERSLSVPRRDLKRRHSLTSGRRPEDRLVGQALPPHQLAGDHHLHHLGGAVADLEPDDVAHPLLEWQLVGVPVVAMEQQALVDGVDGQARPPPLGHRRLLGVGPALVGEPERPVAEPAARLQMRGRLRDRERDALEPDDRVAERLPLLHVGDGLLDRLLGHTQAGERDADAVVVEALHDLVEPGALLAQAMRRRYPDVVEGEHRARDGARAHVPSRAARDAGQVERHQERADPAGSPGRIGAREDDRGVGRHAEADAGLLPGEHVVIAVSL